MKKYIILATFLYSLQGIAQSSTPSEALRFSNSELNGTARFNAMGGAFGAVGGDMSAMGINPAGSLFFNYNTASFSLHYANNNNKSSYLGNTSKDKSNNFDIGQAGAVMVFSNPENTINKIAISINYQSTNNFKNKFQYHGISNQSSVDQYFLDYANGINGLGTFPINYATDYNFADFSNFADQQAWLGYNSYLLDFDNTTNEYYTNVPNNVTHNQLKMVSQKGFNSKLQFNFAGAIKDKIMLGVNLNAHITNIEKSFTIREQNNGIYNTGRTINRIDFDNSIYTSGGGFSLDLGAIYKVTEDFRLGLAYNSPTWFKVVDEVQQGVYTVRTEENDPNNYIANNLYPSVTTIFDSYNYRIPSKFTGSFSGIIGKRWLISADASVTDHSKTKFTSNGYENLNNYFKNNLDTSFEYRIGTEFLIKKVALRAGYKFTESPYKNENLAPNGDVKTITAGLGYNFGKSRLDLAYALTDRNFNDEYISNDWNNTANVKNKNNAVTLTYTVNF